MTEQIPILKLAKVFNPRTMGVDEELVIVGYEDAPADDAPAATEAPAEAAADDARVEKPKEGIVAKAKAKRKRKKKNADA